MSNNDVDSAIALRPRARILRTLGEKLISSETLALIELVKNSYYADASFVPLAQHARRRDLAGEPTGTAAAHDGGGVRSRRDGLRT